MLVQNKILYVDAGLRRLKSAEKKDQEKISGLKTNLSRLQREHALLIKYLLDDPVKMENFLTEKLQHTGKLLLIRFYPYSLYVSGVKKALQNNGVD